MKLILTKIGFFTAFIIPALVITGFYAGGYWNYLTILFSFILIPLIDHAMGIDTSNVPTSESKIKSEEFFYRFVTYCWTYFQIAFVIWGIGAITSGKLQNATEWIGFTMSFALVTGGIGITVAHELGHKNQKPSDSIPRCY